MLTGMSDVDRCVRCRHVCKMLTGVCVVSDDRPSFCRIGAATPKSSLVRCCGMLCPKETSATVP